MAVKFLLKPDRTVFLQSDRQSSHLLTKTASINLHEVYRPETIQLPPPRVDIIGPAEESQVGQENKHFSKILFRGHSQPQLLGGGKEKVERSSSEVWSLLSSSYLYVQTLAREQSQGLLRNLPPKYLMPSYLK